jgi:hypothetical protein
MKFIKQWLRAFLGINDERNGQRFEEIMLGIGATNEKLARIEASLEYRAQTQPRRAVPVYPQSWEEVQAVALAQFDDPKKGN